MMRSIICLCCVLYGCAGILEAYPVVAKDSDVEAPVAREIKVCPPDCEEEEKK